MFRFALRMYFAQIRESKKIYLILKIIFLTSAGCMLAAKDSVSTYMVLMGGIMQLSICPLEFSKLLYIMPQRRENLTRLMILNCRIRTAVESVYLVFAAILLHTLSDGQWMNIILIRFLLTMILVQILLYMVNLPAAYCKRQKWTAIRLIIGAVTGVCVALAGLKLSPDYSVLWVIMSLASLGLAEGYLQVCSRNVEFSDYDEDRKIIKGQVGSVDRIGA